MVHFANSSGRGSLGNAKKEKDVLRVGAHRIHEDPGGARGSQELSQEEP